MLSRNAGSARDVRGKASPVFAVNGVLGWRALRQPRQVSQTLRPRPPAIASMNVLLLLGGIADPKLPLPTAPSMPTLLSHRRERGMLSPFDAAALEIALKLRDSDAATRIDALVAAGPDDALLRHVAGYRLDRVAALDPARVVACDAMAVARDLAHAGNALDCLPQILLIGREFGDMDDGSVPPLLAEALGLPHVGLALSLEMRDGTPWALHQRGGGLIWRALREPVVVSVTNDARNRLRHALLKNVMAAKRLRFDACESSPAAVAALTLRHVVRMENSSRSRACQMLQGDAPAQARALADVLLAHARP